jgi:gliding motility-associated-like protein
MRIIFALFLTVLFSAGTTKAQNVLFEIEGEDYYEACAPWCETFQLNLDSSYIWEQVWMTLTPDFGTSITQNGNDVFVVCIDFPGTYILEAQGIGFNANGEQYFGNDSVLIFLFDYGVIEGEITSSVCQDDSIERGDCLKVCEFTEATYTINPLNGTTVDGYWFVQGAISYIDNGMSVDVVWGAAGMGYVEFYPFTYCDSEPVYACVEVLPTPEPEFNSLPEIENGIIQLCKGQPLYLENLTEHASRYEWTFGDGGTSDLFEPEYIYQTPGNYTLTLNAFNVCHCEASISVEVEVLPAPAPELSCVATVCPDDKVRYVASTDGCQTFYWTVSGNGTVLSGGSTTDDFIEVEWGAGPDGIIELLVEDCNQPYCTKPAIFRIPIVSTDGPISGDAHVCSGELVTYKAPYFPGVDYTWSTSGLGTIVSGQNTNAVSIQWAQVNSIRPNELVNVSYGHCYLGCNGSDQFNVSIVPNMNVNGPSQFCENGNVEFSSSAGFSSQMPVISSWALFNENGDELWTSGIDDDEVTILLNYAPGQYTVIATPSAPSDVCQSQVEKDFIITPVPEKPLGILGDSFICPGLIYSFEVQNAGSYQTHWMITDGGTTATYEGQIMNHTFGNTPPYLVEASHGDLIYPACRSEFISKIIQPATTAQIIGPDENCHQENTIYEVYELPGNILEWRVEPSNMAEVSNKNNQQAEFYWTRSGNAQVILAVCGQDIIKNVVIHALPQPVVNHPAGLCNNEVADVSTTIDYVSQIWRDSAGVIISTDSTTALLPGYYSVDVTDVNGCVGTTAFEIEFYPTPTARISTLGNTGQCMNVDPIELVANTDGANFSFQWYFDGSPVGANAPTYMASAFGPYQVEIVNQYGCSVRSNIIRVFDWCGGSSGTCNGQTCSFPCVEYGDLMYDHSSIDCNTKRYQDITVPAVVPGSEIWYIEESNGSYITIPGADIQHTYMDAGYYTVIQTAKIDGFPYIDPDCFHLVAFKDTVPLASRFEYHGACALSDILFEDLSTFLPDYGITDWAWDFGDGGTSSIQNPIHQYAAPGTYIATLVTTSTSGCTSTVQGEVLVFAPPTLNILAMAEACENNPVSFEVTSTQNPFNVNWDFLDPTSANNTATSQSAFHTYETPDIYFPNVTAENIYTCASSTSTTIEIIANTLAGDITSSNGRALCEGETTDLSAPAGGQLWDWITDEIVERITIEDAGYYDVIVTDEHGCQYAPDPLFIEVNPKPIVKINGREIFGPNDIGPWSDTVETCQGVDIELSAFSNSSVTYIWNTTQTTERISFTDEAGNLLSAGQHIISVEVTDLTTNCTSDPAEIVVIVHNNPPDFTITLTAGTACSGTTNTLQVNSPQAGVVYVWSDGQVGTQIDATESGMYTVIATNEFGCITESINSIIVKPSPRVDLFPSGCFIRCNPDTICIPPISDVSYYEILLDNVVLESGVNVPGELIATVSGTYTLYLESVNGCSATSESLNLELYPGFGHIDVLVFVDVNGNGIIDAADSTISDVGVLLSENNTLYNSLLTNEQGSAYFLNVPQGTYVAAIDTNNIPGGMIPMINNQIIDIIGCDLDFADSLLIRPCAVDVALDVAACPGEAVEIGDTTIYPNGNFIYFQSGGGVACDTTFNVTLLPGNSGHVAIYAYFDVDENGILDLTDSLIGNFPIILNEVSTMTTTNANTDTNGELIFPTSIGSWDIELDPLGLPFDWEIIIGDTTLSTLACDTIVVNLLMGPICEPARKNYALKLCAGDSVLIQGAYYYAPQSLEFTVAGGPCDSLLSYEISAAEEIVIEEITRDVCEGELDGEIKINGSSNNGPVMISWNHTSDTSFELGGLSPQAYQYEVTDGLCTIGRELLLGEYIFPNIELTETDPACPGSRDGEIIVSLASPELTWSLDGVSYHSDEFTNLAAGDYTLYFTNGNCVQTRALTLEEKTITPFEMVSLIDLPVNTAIEITHNYLDSLSHTFNWNPTTYLNCEDCISPVFSGSEEDVQLAVIVTDPDGCEQEAQVFIRADQSQHIFIPNAFSPNDDNVNDRFKPYVREGVVSTTSLQIFDRWGDQVYEENILSDQVDINGWDGKRNGDHYNPGLFIYKASFTYTNGNVKEVFGEVHLIR